MDKKYEFSISKLSGEELLTLDEVLSDIVIFSEEPEDEGDSFYRYIEKLHEQKYSAYLKNNPTYCPPNNHNYDDDSAWMYAQTAVVNMELGRIDDDRIDNYFSCKGWNVLNEEQEKVWKKATA